MKLYNTLTRSLQEFTPLAPPRVTMYVCGPTVYDVPHLGHARSAYVFDVLCRYLQFKGYQVTFVRNVTDVDDKIIQKAREELGTGDMGHGTGSLKAKCAEVAERYLKSYHDTLDRLGILPPNLEPKATEHVVPDQQNVEVTKKIDASMTGFISQLLTRNMAYPAGGDVYFPVRKCADYGKLSNRSLDDLKSGAPEATPVGARVEPGEHKEDPLDFALWKAAKPDEPSWNSPWGPGRPGWHIECSVMSTTYLGDAFDIHGGGVDLVFPHHENEIAQARALDKPFARYWIHNGLLTVNGEKMSKSLGNYTTVDQALKTYSHPDYLKLFFLKTHYRSPIDYSTEKMTEAKKNWEEFSWFLQHYDQLAIRGTPGIQLEIEVPNFEKQFTDAMDDDLNTPQATAVLFEVVRCGRDALAVRTVEQSARANHCRSTLLHCGMMLGLFQQGIVEVDTHTRNRIQSLVQERKAARQAKDFTKADTIRKQLQDEGYHLTDIQNETVWRKL